MSFYLTIKEETYTQYKHKLGTGYLSLLRRALIAQKRQRLWVPIPPVPLLLKNQRTVNQADLNFILQQAKSENTSPQLLEELAKHENILVRQAVVENPNTPTKILFDLSAKFPEQFIANPLLDLLLLENWNFFVKIPKETLMAILPLERVPEYFLKWASQQDDETLILAAIYNSKISSANLKELIRHDSKEVSEAASLHCKYSDKINLIQEEEKIEKAIERSYRNRGYDSREIHSFQLLICLYDLIPENIQKKLPLDLKTRYGEFQYPVCDFNNPYNRKESILERQKNKYKNRLIHKYKHENWEDCLDRAFAAKNPDTPINILQELVKDNNKSIRCYAAKNPNLPYFLRRQLAEDKHKSVRASVAKSPHTPASILELLAQPKYGVRHEIAKNPNTPAYIIRELAKNKHIKVSDRIAKNPATPPDVLLNIINLIKDDYYHIRRRITHNIALNPNATATVLKQLVQYCNNDDFLFILSHPNCTLEVKKLVFNCLAEKISKTHPSYRLVRLAVLFNNYAEASVLAANVRSIYWIERYAIATNPNTPQSTREILARDSNIIVSNAARGS